MGEGIIVYGLRRQTPYRQNSNLQNKSIADSGGSKGAKRSQSQRGATERGYTNKMVKNIVGMEQKYRRNKDETLHVFNSKGDIVTSIGGKGAEVRFNSKEIPRNSILTHNHPRSLGAKGIRRIGNSFSDADIVSAVKVNAREMRAVTPTYTFSVKRPKGGWGVSPREAKKAFADANRRVFSQGEKYLQKTGYNESNIARAEVTHFHKVMKVLSKKYG